MYQMKKDRLTELFQAISGTKDLFLPLRKCDQTNYGLWTPEEVFDLETLKTVKSAKDCFFPQSEVLYRCKTEDGKISIDPQKLCDRPFVVFGMRACDVKAVEVLDRVFLSEPVDPEETCFCRNFGIDAAAPGADVETWIVGDSLYWKPLTEKGEALTESLQAVLEAADGEASACEAEETVAREQEAIRGVIEKLPFSHLDLSRFQPENTMELFDSPLWEELYKPCLACGTCTFVCPTCQCYDIRDFDSGKNGVQRYRCWDSCMYSDFTMMAHGNLRTSQMQRFRQRFMHKLVYYPANNDGLYSCVGCGRCVSKCPASLNIVKVIKKLGGEA